MEIKVKKEKEPELKLKKEAQVTVHGVDERGELGRDVCKGKESCFYL